MTLLLNGELLPGLDHRVSIAEEIDRKDLSGQTSASAGSFGGWKPALVSVRLLVDMERPEELAALRALWHQADEATGAPALWTIAEPACDALGIHLVRFTDSLRVVPAEREQVWEVTLILIEETSVPERAEARRPEPPLAEPTEPAGLVPASSGDSGFIERVLTVLNEQAGKLFFDGEKPP